MRKARLDFCFNPLPLKQEKETPSCDVTGKGVLFQSTPSQTRERNGFHSVHPVDRLCFNPLPLKQEKETF
ncbi:hypothetical protein LEP1GSC072_1771 [Leptospira noguchii str. Bonito]|nr:hypothetical protein LEP1GSC072_1771 [Leptospira noguchii str. Bonito]